jgi:AcrR family transcriptional regulator
MPSSTLRTRHRDRRETHRQQILDAARDFLRHQAYREMSVEALMADAGLSRTSFYRHFDGLAELVLELLDTAGAELTAIARAWSEVPDDDLLAQAHGTLSAIVDFFARRGPVFNAVAQAASYDERIEERYGALRDGFVALTADGFRRLGHPYPEDLALALNLMNERYLLEQFGDRTRAGDPARATATLEWIWLGAMRAPEPGMG